MPDAGANPQPEPFTALIKPTGAACNLDCEYCFFLSKEALWNADRQSMDSATLDALLRNFFASQPDGDVTLAWQGGEPLLRGLDFYASAIELAERYRRPGQRVQHSIQTNGVLIDERWAALFARHDFLVGVSIDGPPELHDTYRVNRAGRRTYAQVRRGWDVLAAHDIRRNVLCTINAANAEFPETVYDHLSRDVGAEFLQFIPVVEHAPLASVAIAENRFRDDAGRYVPLRQSASAAGVTTRSVAPGQYGQFMTRVFDRWLATDVGRVFVTDFDAMLGARLGRYSICVHAPTCGTALAVNHEGTAYSCDHYVEPAYALGDVAAESFSSMLQSPHQRAFGSDKLTNLPPSCLQCDVRWACNGGCPKDRFATASQPDPRLNYLCEGYYAFFHHAEPVVTAMARAVRRGDLAENWRRYVPEGDVRP